MKTAKAREIVNTVIEELLQYAGMAEAWDEFDDNTHDDIIDDCIDLLIKIED